MVNTGRRHFTASHVRLVFWVGLFSFLFSSPVAANQNLCWVSGPLPPKGTIVIRSGLAWLDESSSVFRVLHATLEKEITHLGFTVIPVAPSTLDPLPETPLPAKKHSVSSVPSTKEKTEQESLAAQKAKELGSGGKLPQLKLRSYTVPQKDADMPPAVMAITPPDVTRALFAKSQQMGQPEMRTFSIPGRMPKELTTDAAKADYVLLAKFAVIRPMTGAEKAAPPLLDGLSGVSVAAVGVQGVGRLGIGLPAAPSSTRTNRYGTPGGYARGYENPSGSGDFWHRDNDFYQRDYQFKYGPQPQYATPPKDFVPYRGLSPVPSLPHAQTEVYLATVPTWHLLLLDCFALAPTRHGKEPEILWRAASRALAEDSSLENALPKLSRAIFAAIQN